MLLIFYEMFDHSSYLFFKNYYIFCYDLIYHLNFLKYDL
jgi:hypothetical protein